MTIPAQHLSVLLLAQTGDSKALAYLLELYQPNIRRYAQLHCLISDVDDAVQETLLILSRKISSIRLVAAFSGWLFKVVQRECRRLGRKAFNFDPYEEEKLEKWIATHSIDELRFELIRALESLSYEHRQIILLRDFAEMSIREIANEINLTVAATKSRLHRARTSAREYLLA